MEELRIAFIVVGAFAILGILIHGLWTIRKNAQVKKSLAAELLPPEEKVDTLIDSDDPLLDQNIDFQTASREEPVVDDIDILDVDDTIDEKSLGKDYDDLGLGEVRIVSQEAKVETEELDHTEKSQSFKTEEFPPTADTLEEGSQTKSDKLFEKAPEYDMRLSRPDRNEEWVESSMPPPPSSLLKEGERESQSQPDLQDEKVEVTESVIPESVESAPPENLLKTKVKTPDLAKKEPKVAEQESSKEEVANKPSLAEQARNLVKRKKATQTKRKEPKLSDDQMSIDFDDSPAPIEEPVEDAAPAQPVEQEVLVLNVKAADGAPIPGAALLPMLLTLGFKFGDQDIFHRHVNSNGKGPVLFSLANMFKPGVFDIDNLENFSTQGISLFMILPIEGDAHQVFNMMHNAARKISDEFGAQVLDGRRSRLNKQSLQQYVEKIREFERKRMIRRH